MKVLFIGGPADGERIDIENRGHFNVPEPIKPEKYISGYSSNHSPLKFIRYRREELCWNSQLREPQIYPIMIPEGDDIDSVLFKLLMGYKGSIHSGETMKEGPGE